ncbi:hypothetical protein K491DRAFT_784072 [Lophiostoma macrostomum CBS 122681]|uniref:histidine kinase n=1 Tax=Lophiostoma macrostomum CBS 122681 TaxID=1314788 RepID=A0A6A6SLD7_9PLEO|nr:hypothetical protein K491DRAFT_784072 [Lophiostoma macrostomum CBS 122681]
MASLQQLRAEYELNKYHVLLHPRPGGASTLTYALSPDTVLQEELSTHLELLVARLDAATRHHLLAGGCRREPDGDSDAQDASVFDAWQDESAKWIALFRNTSAARDSTDAPSPPSQPTRLYTTSQAPELPSSLSGFCGVPVVSQYGHTIGLVFVVLHATRRVLPPNESKHLAKAAQRCLHLLDHARERVAQGIWARVNRALDQFVKSRAVMAHILEEPRTTAAKYAPSSEDSSEPPHINPEAVAEEPFLQLGSPGVEGTESKRLLRAEIDRDQRIADDDNNTDALSLKSDVGEEGEHEEGSSAETTYRKVFKRASQCLREAFQCDGVLFTDGLIGFHGTIQPVPQSEQELEHEVRGSRAQPGDRSSGRVGSSNSGGRQGAAAKQDTHTRSFTSNEFQRGARVDRPSEILGLSANVHVRPNTTPLSATTLGLEGIDEGFLQRVIDRHPDGAVWYFDSRLAGCFAWKKDGFPVFSDLVDLPALKGFLHVVESEIARFDAAAAVKQQESFVSSVSHELRTPLHGILGTVQLLKDSDLDEMQKSLVNTIHFCGDNLHDTLTSVLSYAKINQFERRQHKYRNRRPPDATWALPDKEGHINTNIAMLCEEIVGVLEAGQSFQHPTGSENVVVVLNVEYDDIWSYFTEPGAIRRIAVNLIGNALKYTSKGSVIVSLRVTRLIQDPHTVSNDLDSGRTLILSVKDTGRGISKQFIQNKLFIPFIQESAGSPHGVGLGMSIVKSLVTLLSGEIHVESEVGKGTEMRVVLPMRSCTLDEREDEEKRPHEVEFGQTIQTLRAKHLHLCIFGFPAPVRESLRNYMEQWFHCTILENTDNAEPHIVLVDEGNEDVRNEVHRTAELYGDKAVLLNIVMTSSRMGSPMEAIKGYKVWERIPRPLGPSNMGQTLLRCLGKLKTLQDASSQQTDMKNQEDLVGGGSGEQGAGYKMQGGSGKVMASESQENDDHQGAQDTKDEQTLGSATLRPKDTDSVAQSQSSLRVLLVDDNALNLRLLNMFLKKAGHGNITEGENGEEAVEAVRNSRDGFDVVFMDMSMPVMDGFAATRQIRIIETERHRPDKHKAIVVALTGLAGSRDADRAFEAGVDMFLTKPISFTELSKVLRQCKERVSERLEVKNPR